MKTNSLDPPTWLDSDVKNRDNRKRERNTDFGMLLRNWLSFVDKSVIKKQNVGSCWLI